MTLSSREYGASGPAVVLLHGGPGAGGYLGPLARGLSDSFRVFEPLQRASGGEPLTVARHVADLEDWLERLGETRPAIVGHSWGAMLALAHSAAHPERVGSLVLIGCGTFDRESRDRLRATVEARLTDELRRRLDRLKEDFPDENERLRQMGSLLLPLYSHDAIDGELTVERCDARGHDETWRDMLRLQEEGSFPAAFAAIEAPVLMLHGAVDPHPGPSTRDTLKRHLPYLEYEEWESCGHYPWLERSVRDEFFVVLRRWLSRGGRP